MEPIETFEAVEELLNCDYVPYKLLGRGSFGSVYAVTRYGQQYAVKAPLDTDAGISSDIMREIDIMRRFDHPGLMPATEVLTAINCASFNPAIIMPLGSMTLGSFVRNPTTSLFEALKMLFEVASGIALLHEHHILHLDIKPINIVVFPDKSARLADFGLATYVDNIQTGRLLGGLKVTYPYRAPEIFSAQGRSPSIRYTSAVDVWAFGMVLFEVIAGTLPWSHLPEYYAVMEINRFAMGPAQYITRLFELRKLPDPLARLTFELLMNIFKLQPADRISMEQVLQSQLFEPFQAVSGRVAIPRLIPPPELPPALLEELITGVREIWQLVKTNKLLASERVASFFMGIDIYYRAIEFFMDDYPELLQFVTRAALLIGVKLLNDEINPPTGEDLAPEEYQRQNIVRAESIIVGVLQGRLQRPTLYDMAKSLEELKSMYSITLNPELYFKQQTYIAESSTNKDVKAGEFLDSL